MDKQSSCIAIFSNQSEANKALQQLANTRIDKKIFYCLIKISNKALQLTTFISFLNKLVSRKIRRIVIYAS